MASIGKREKLHAPIAINTPVNASISQRCAIANRMMSVSMARTSAHARRNGVRSHADQCMRTHARRLCNRSGLPSAGGTAAKIPTSANIAIAPGLCRADCDAVAGVIARAATASMP
ncbi:hypothetical protein [Xanthomonas euroxanthea]|uniref:hypothetical protein n=2 Tax=Xanthomonas euroxanthea TaxID=2259622 RepID=UPI0015F289CE|nr:hypothetical protein [Xanthomonas euroxanthea]